MEIENDNIGDNEDNNNDMSSDSTEEEKEIQVEVTEISDDLFEINSEDDDKQDLDFDNLEVN